jgi:alpha-D-ribose 1-methylphosphonate 5-triphosphate synthase subunit PhnI
MDSVPDSFLTDRAGAALHWQDASGEHEYEIALCQADRSTLVCALTGAPADSTHLDLSGCSLAPDTLYWRGNG